MMMPKFDEYNVLFDEVSLRLIDTDASQIVDDQEYKATETIACFNYGRIEQAALADDMRAAAGRVRGHVRASVIEVGRELIAIKARMIPHGDFVAWVEAECGLGIRTAQRLMKAAEFLDRTKSDKLSFLPVDGLLALAAIPSEDVAAHIVERIDRGELTAVCEIKAAIGQLHPKRRNVAHGGEHSVVVEEPIRHSSVLPAEDAGIVLEKPEVWLVARTDTDHEPAAPGVQDAHRTSDLLAVAIHTVKNLSPGDLADFDRWYCDTYRIAEGREAVEANIVVRDDQETLTPAGEQAPEPANAVEAIEHETSPRDDQRSLMSDPVQHLLAPDMVEVEAEPLIAAWQGFKRNVQKCGRAWVLDGGPVEVSSGEHFVITERLAPWRDAYRVAHPEKQEAIRRWFELQHA
jgi:hypothetical protein